MAVCKNCKQHVIPQTKKFTMIDWLLFCIGLMCVGVGALIFVVVRNMIVRKRCPHCGCKM